jgi:hypothetical protein
MLASWNRRNSSSRFLRSSSSARDWLCRWGPERRQEQQGVGEDLDQVKEVVVIEPRMDRYDWLKDPNGHRDRTGLGWGQGIRGLME